MHNVPLMFVWHRGPTKVRGKGKTYLHGNKNVVKGNGKLYAID